MTTKTQTQTQTQMTNAQRKAELMQEQQTLVSNYKALKKPTEKDKKEFQIKSLSNLIMLHNFNDLIEWEQEKNPKSYFLTNFLRDEAILRAYKKNKLANYIEIEMAITKPASRCLIGLGFMQSNYMELLIKPCKEFNIIRISITPDNITNAQREYLNRKYEIDIPLTAEQKQLEDDLNLFDMTNLI